MGLPGGKAVERAEISGRADHQVPCPAELGNTYIQLCFSIKSREAGTNDWEKALPSCPSSELTRCYGGLHQGVWLQLFQPAALTATSKQGTQNKARDIEIDPFTGGAQLSSGSYHKADKRCSKVLPEALLQRASSMLLSV